MTNLKKSRPLALALVLMLVVSLFSICTLNVDAATTDNIVDRPVPVQGLVYNTKDQLAVAGNPAYSLTLISQDGGWNISFKDGDVYGQKAGTYYMKATLKEGYAWSNGGTDPYEFSFFIDYFKVPKPSGVYQIVYNGKLQDAPKFTHVELTQGNTRSTHVGVYWAEYEPVSSSYVWEDGTRDRVRINWEIIPAEQAPLTIGVTEINVSEATDLQVTGGSSNSPIKLEVVENGTGAEVTITEDGMVLAKAPGKIVVKATKAGGRGYADYKPVSVEATITVVGDPAPVDPVDPVDPVKPDDKKPAGPSTDDATDMALFVILLALSGAGTATIVRRRKN